MAASFPDDSVFETDGSGNVTLASVTATGVRAVTADTNAVLTNTDHLVTFSTTGAGTRTITATALTPGKVIHLAMTAQSTGTYTCTVDEGTLTFDAADECATVIAITASTFRVLALRGATIV
jgi:hypothetical protein